MWLFRVIRVIGQSVREFSYFSFFSRQVPVSYIHRIYERLLQHYYSCHSSSCIHLVQRDKTSTVATGWLETQEKGKMNVTINRELSISLLCCLSCSVLRLLSTLRIEKLQTKRCMDQWPISDKKYGKLLNDID